MIEDPRLVWFAITVTVELVVASVLLARVDSFRARLATIATVNAVSFPLALAAINAGAPWSFVELAVIALEGAGYALLLGATPGRACTAAIIANVVTAALGLAVGW